MADNIVPQVTSQQPYWDDFNEDKLFLRMLFRPGFAVQGRELTQLQTILQKQVDRFGKHIFKNGWCLVRRYIAGREARHLSADY